MDGRTFAESMELVARFFEAIGALILLAGLIVSAVLAIRSLRVSKQARGLPDFADVLRRCDSARAGGVGCRRPCPDRCCCTNPGECCDSRDDRADSHGPQLLARDRDRGGGPLAAGGDERSQLHCSCRQTQRRNQLSPPLPHQAQVGVLDAANERLVASGPLPDRTASTDWLSDQEESGARIMKCAQTFYCRPIQAQ